MALIYGLSSSCEPGNIRYVGKTTNLDKRLKRHLSKYCLKDDTYKNRWIKTELKKGHQIHISLLERVLDENWEECEIKWIKTLKKQGFNLTNGTEGGEGLMLDSREVIDKRNETKKKNNLEAKKIEIKKFKIKESIGRWTGERKCIECNKTLIHTAKNFSAIIHLLRKSENKKCLVCRSIGRTLSQEAKDKISKSKENLTQETRDKFSKLHKGKTISKKTRAKLRKANLGKTQSQETIDKRTKHRKRKILCTNNNIEYESIKEACKDLSCSSASVIKVLNKKQEQTKGYNFIYKKDSDGKN